MQWAGYDSNIAEGHRPIAHIDGAMPVKRWNDDRLTSLYEYRFQVFDDWFFVLVVKIVDLLQDVNGFTFKNFIDFRVCQWFVR